MFFDACLLVYLNTLTQAQLNDSGSFVRTLSLNCLENVRLAEKSLLLAD